MSIQGSAGAASAAREVIEIIDEFLRETKDLVVMGVLQKLRARVVKEVYEPAESGW